MGTPTRAAAPSGPEGLDVVGAVRRRWRVFLALLVVSVLAAAALALLLPSTFVAHARLSVSADATGEAANDVERAKELAPTYARLAVGSRVTQAVVRELQLDETPRELRERVSAGVPAGTVIVDVRVRDRAPDRARDIADAVSRQAVRVVAAVEADAGRRGTRLVIAEPAELPDQRAAPQRSLILMLGLGFGLGSGALAAAAAEAAARR